jgi:hypothetical protein
LLEVELRKQTELRRTEATHQSQAEEQVAGINRKLEKARSEATGMRKELEELRVASASGTSPHRWARGDLTRFF